MAELLAGVSLADILDVILSNAIPLAIAGLIGYFGVKVGSSISSSNPTYNTMVNVFGALFTLLPIMAMFFMFMSFISLFKNL